MPPRFPNRLGRWVLLSFAIGLAGGFVWALVRRHPASAYREALAQAIAENAENAENPEDPENPEDMAEDLAADAAEEALTDPDEEPEVP